MNKEVLYGAGVATRFQLDFIMSNDFDNLPNNIDIAYGQLAKIVPFGIIAIKLNKEIQLINAKHEALVTIKYLSWPLIHNSNTSTPESMAS